jgi:hypothetical protein
MTFVSYKDEKDFLKQKERGYLFEILGGASNL